MNKLELIAVSPYAAGVGASTSVEAPDIAEPGDVLLLDLFLSLPPLHPDYAPGYLFDTPETPRDWFQVAETEIVRVPALGISQLLRLWHRVADGDSIAEFSWRTERPYALQLRTMGGLAQLGTPIRGPGRWLWALGPTRVEIEMADAADKRGPKSCR